MKLTPLGNFQLGRIVYAVQAAYGGLTGIPYHNLCQHRIYSSPAIKDPSIQQFPPFKTNYQ